MDVSCSSISIGHQAHRGIELHLLHHAYIFSAEAFAAFLQLHKYTI